MALREVAVSSDAELEKELANQPEDALFRGQVKDYRNKAGLPTFPTSMARKGCLPPFQYKWSHYAYRVLKVAFPDAAEDVERHREQALLQHYGWRSFFIDATSNPAVAAWFASHAFEDNSVFNLGEDCYGNSVTTFHQQATYKRASGLGHIYVISRTALERVGVKAFDLRGVSLEGTRLRTNAQSAWLLGALAGELPPEVVTCHIEAPTEILSRWAARSGITTVEDLFPSRDEDSILQLFLSVPWEAVSNDPRAPRTGLNAFVRGLRLPEYDYAFACSHPPEIAFYRTNWISDGLEPGSDPLTRAQFYRVPEILFHMGRTQPAKPMPDLSMALSENAMIIMESSGLIRYPPFIEEAAYLKGVCAQRAGNVVEVSEVGLDHPGSVIRGTWINRGWFYEVKPDGTWTRIKHVDECPCKHEMRHEDHLSSLMMLDTMMAGGHFRQIKEREFEFVAPQ